MSEADWQVLFYKVARHVPGLGGVATFNELERSEVLDLCARLIKDLDREAEAWRAALR